MPRPDADLFASIPRPEKFFPLAELIPLIKQEKDRNQRIALANGGFDLLHIGHIRYLKQAGETADKLIVAVNSDASLRGLKGGNRRIVILSALACVDYVTVFEEKTVDSVLSALEPHIHCKGSDYTVESVPERETVRSYGGETVIVGGEKIHSTSDVLSHIRVLDE